MKKAIILFLFFVFLINNASAEISTYTDRDNNFEISYPSDWNYFKNYAGADLYLSDPYGYASVNIIVMDSGGMTLDEIADGGRELFNDIGVYPYNERYITLNGVDGFEWKLQLTNTYTYEVYEEKQVNLIYGGKVYTITAAAPQYYYSDYSTLFDAIINTFTITEPITKPTPRITTTTSRPSQPTYTQDVRPTTTQSKPAQTTPKPSASVELHGEKTDVERGEDIILKLSAVNKITKPIMKVQVILIPPSGMSVTSSEFVTSGAGQYTTTYELKPGEGKDIEVRIKTNQEGAYDVKGTVIYYYGEDKATAEEIDLKLPINVRKSSVSSSGVTSIASENNPQESPFVSLPIFILLFGIFFRYVKKRN